MENAGTLSSHRDERLRRAYLSLDGLSVGDALGERFFVHPSVLEEMDLIASRALPAPPWPFTDDTQIALSIVAVLRDVGEIDQDRLAQSFAERYDPSRGYGPAMHGLLARIGRGEPWRTAARDLFAGQGSFGNGAAMRVAPLGAYFADDLDQVAEQAARSAEVTHAHPEGIAGAIAVATAAALAWRSRVAGALPSRADFVDRVMQAVPQGEVRSRLRRARDLSATAPVQTAVGVLGNGSHVSAQDTVPFALWCAGSHLDDYEEALWLTVSGLGDRDTTCAMAGGVVALSATRGVPATWLRDREPLPEWVFQG
jgi:ADP-ribosylglycohydrolase